MLGADRREDLEFARGRCIRVDQERPEDSGDQPAQKNDAADPAANA
ncbi:hypothetical protein CBM2592_U70003 [Cupriavidus taiwanensis]|nr:hypothetical protein CBM2592_U70003 [Cupriavidus taiwanensis]